MNRIRKIKFFNHPILKDLELNFCDHNGNAADTIIFAGENGCGKSTILDALYTFVAQRYLVPNDVRLEMDYESKTISIEFKRINKNQCNTRISDSYGKIINHLDLGCVGIYSDVNINFHSQPLSNVTSLNIDENKGSRRSQEDFPTQINQLLIDIQSLDNDNLARAYKEAQLKGETTDNLTADERLSRFKKAFSQMFDGLTYSHIDNKNGAKKIIFTKNGVEIPIENLSSGEKQIVYRGCFLLKDANATNGAFVFIDEPEISLHPKWQMKIMEYYKGIFTNENGEQTSQIFAVTHSPFIIHNDNRKNDKVIVLARNENGDIIVKDKPEYFKCNSIEAVQDAFSVSNFTAGQPTVYLEGRTDEKYFKKALEVFGYAVPFQFQWVGHLKDDKSEEFTGEKSLNKAYQFLIGCNLPYKNICLFDCDTNRQETNQNNVYTMAIPQHQNSKNMKKGIENALVLDSINVTPYYSTKEKEGDYGEKSTITEFQKMDFCNYICSLDNATLQTVFSNLKTEIDRINALF